MKGLVAFVRAAAMKSSGTGSAATQRVFPTGHCLDRNEGPLSPGEGGA